MDPDSDTKNSSSLFGWADTHIKSAPVTEMFQGKTVWDGVVEVFDLTGHPKANRVYASAQTKKTRKPGRPRLPKGHAKSRIVPVRFNAEDIKKIADAAKASNKTASEWIRSALYAAIEG